MLRLVVLFSLVACAFAGVIQQERIVGGKEADIAEFPWQVSLQNGEKHICGGAILSSRVVITAGRCVENFKSAAGLSIYAGSNELKRGGVRAPVERFLMHPEYNKYTRKGDIALLYLTSPLAYSKTIKPIKLSTYPPSYGWTMDVTGWGGPAGSEKSSSSLQTYKVLRSGENKCNMYWPGAINRNMFCAQPDEGTICQGEVGAPISWNATRFIELYGIASWDERCGDYLGVYTSIYDLSPWILENL